MNVFFSKTTISIDPTQLIRRNEEITKKIETLQKEKEEIETLLSLLQNISTNKEKIYSIKNDIEKLGYKNVIKLTSESIS